MVSLVRYVKPQQFAFACSAVRSLSYTRPLAFDKDYNSGAQAVSGVNSVHKDQHSYRSFAQYRLSVERQDPLILASKRKAKVIQPNMDGLSEKFRTMAKQVAYNTPNVDIGSI
ncbi:BA75_04735T0 [Komagataella pastoris]|uniref:BA75_04735T0 n=1 Tax=Komagataella pastoris TaxID=4922 RepID=A0A1B2JJE3_PICPA|nr:BA75_04735T0 [Komagataella pastoris]